MNRGEVWLVDFDPQAGAEIQKRRPAVVISSTNVGKLPLRIVVPLTTHNAAKDPIPWFVKVIASMQNGLDRDTSADCFQVKSVSTERLVRKLGTLSSDDIEEIAAGIVLCVGYNPRV